jgi:hypothetical protein
MALVQQSDYRPEKMLPGIFTQCLAQRRVRMAAVLLAFVAVVAALMRLVALGYLILALWSACALVAWLFISGAARAADASERRG